VSPTDVLVVGGGPAGAAAARLLALWGHGVSVLTRPAGYSLGESIPPSTVKVFREIGVLDAIDAARFHRSTGNTVWWGGTEARVERFAAGATGWQIERPALDRILLAEAGRAGARVHPAASVRRVTLGDPSLVTFAAAGSQSSIPARWVLDCSGRAGVIARSGHRAAEPGRATFAIYAEWEGAGGTLADPTHTLVESYRDGWAWSVPVSPTRRYATVMVDPRAVGPRRPADLSQVYDAELAKASHLGAVLGGATRCRGPRGLSASPYSAREVAGPGWLLVGDAASFADPLSSYGIKKALASGWLAAVVVASCLEDPAIQPAALELFASREREAARLLARRAADLFGVAGASHGHSFWDERARIDVGTGADAHEPDLDPWRRDPDALAAFEALKRAPALAVRAAGDVELIARPGVRSNRVRLDHHVRWGRQPEGLRYLRGVNVPRVIQLAPAANQVPDLYDAYCRAEPPVPLPDFLGALSVLVARGALVPRS
jgi:flavin-dependent dehydrogenase